MALLVALSTAALHAQAKPSWCNAQPRPIYSTLPHISSPDPWFEVYRVAPDTYAIYEPHQWEETIGYLILGHDRALLFDTGMGIGDLKSVVRSLTSLPVVVLNSHTHNDHVGGNWLFTAAPSGSGRENEIDSHNEVDSMDTPYTRAHAAGSQDYAEDVKSEIVSGAICGTLPPAFNSATYITHPWKVTRWLHDGDTVALGNRTLQIIATPGHAPDSICLLDRAHGLLFTGDTYYNAHIYIFGAGADAVAYGVSVQRLAALAPNLKLVLPAHNEPIAQPSVLPALAAAYQAVLQGKAHIQSGKQNTIGEQAPAIYSYAGFNFDIDPKLLTAAQQPTPRRNHGHD
jgi:glyoxylase-like metal-dependent hydrolase (beta-lactamase superfamily II)